VGAQAQIPITATREQHTEGGIDRSEAAVAKVSESRSASIDIAGAGVLLTEEQALRSLLSRWHIDLDVKNERQVCDRLAARGFACLRGKESFDAILRMNRPVMLRLIEGRAGGRYVMLTSLDGETATLATGRGSVIVNTRELGRRWSGEYLLIWRLPPGYRHKLEIGNRGALVSWMAKALSVSEGKAAGVDGEETYTRKMADRIRRFQVAAGLVPDGRIGPKTFIRLSSFAGGEDPRLSSRPGGP
jgi:general secretion pathway protein A